jgi:hypothetical protein
MARFYNDDDDGRGRQYLRKTHSEEVWLPLWTIRNRCFGATVGFLSKSARGVLPNRQHRVDETPSPEVESETRYHGMGDHPSKTIETLPRE